MDLSLVDWSRAQFAMTVLIHSIFVPLTIGMTYIMPWHRPFTFALATEWERLAKFWAKLLE